MTPTAFIAKWRHVELTANVNVRDVPVPGGKRDGPPGGRSRGRGLDTVRGRWLNPPEWFREESIAFPASTSGPWAAHLVDTPNADGLGIATYRWLAPIDDDAATALKKRALPLLYNTPPAWLEDAHRALDEAVFAAYAWPSAMTDDEVLTALNLGHASRAQAK